MTFSKTSSFLCLPEKMTTLMMWPPWLESTWGKRMHRSWPPWLVLWFSHARISFFSHPTLRCAEYFTQVQKAYRGNAEPMFQQLRSRSAISLCIICQLVRLGQDFLCSLVGQAVGVTEVGPEVVALVSHATQEYLRGLTEKLTVMAGHRRATLEVWGSDSAEGSLQTFLTNQ